MVVCVFGVGKWVGGALSINDDKNHAAFHINDEHSKQKCPQYHHMPIMQALGFLLLSWRQKELWVPRLK